MILKSILVSILVELGAPWWVTMFYCILILLEAFLAPSDNSKNK